MKLLLAKTILVLFGAILVVFMLAMLATEPIVAVILASLFALVWATLTWVKSEL